MLLRGQIVCQWYSNRMSKIYFVKSDLTMLMAIRRKRRAVCDTSEISNDLATAGAVAGYFDLSGRNCEGRMRSLWLAGGPIDFDTLQGHGRLRHRS